MSKSNKKLWKEWQLKEKEAQEAKRKILREQISKIMSELQPREQKILQMRFGLNKEIPRTLEEVGKEFGVTRERIRQIEAKALEKMRKSRFNLIR